jgi:hypothetical protein
LNEKVLNVQIALADAHKEQTMLVETISALKKEIARFETWETQKHRYELRQVAYLGSSAYVIKPDAQGSEPLHCICAACYENARKAVLQPTQQEHARHRYWQCPLCKANVIVEPHFIEQTRVQANATQTKT